MVEHLNNRKFPSFTPTAWFHITLSSELVCDRHIGLWRIAFHDHQPNSAKWNGIKVCYWGIRFKFVFSIITYPFRLKREEDEISYIYIYIYLIAGKKSASWQLAVVEESKSTQRGKKLRKIKKISTKSKENIAKITFGMCNFLVFVIEILSRYIYIYIYIG